ncbi:MAG: PAS domain S-box protein [Steroidobacteraceae bacterium]|nr:PAS domain S-box protein [Deltaproteobacteria bacterium]
MKTYHDTFDPLYALQKKLAGFGEYSIRKTYYPELQQRLEELERFKALIDHSNDALFLIKVVTGRIADVSESACRQMGWTRAEFLETSLFDLSGLANCPEAEKLIKQPLGGGGERTLAVTDLLWKGGGRFLAEITLNRMSFHDEDYVLAVARDITERKRTDEALRQSENFLKNIVDNIPAMVFAKDAAELRYVAINKAGEQLLGYSRDELLGRGDHDLFPEEQAEFFSSKDREVLARRDLLEIPEETIKTRSGEDRILRTRKIPLFDSKGNARYLLGIAEDITDRKQLEEQLLQSQKMEAVGQLAGGVAHDFNNILMVIMGYGGMLKTDLGPDSPHKDKLEQIIDAAERAAQLTCSLLAFSRKQVMKPRAADLKNIVEQVQRFLVRIIGEDIQLRSILAADNLPVVVDSGQIEQVLINLATNARDAMPKGGLLTIGTGLLDIDAAFVQANGYGEPGRYALISVSDSGIGMDEKTRKRIFEPFFTTKEVGKGTGLGMSIVYGIVKQHHGFINVYSEPQIGTTFRIYIPLIARELAECERIITPAPPKGGSETILVAEDDPGVRKLMQEVLTGSGYTVIPAEDGQDAVDKFRANRATVKLILMDIIMPKKSGKEACCEIRLIDDDVKILYSSGYTLDIIQSRDVLDTGAELVMKPVQPLELLRKVRELLDNER